MQTVTALLDVPAVPTLTTAMVFPPTLTRRHPLYLLAGWQRVGQRRRAVPVDGSSALQRDK